MGVLFCFKIPSRRPHCIQLSCLLRVLWYVDGVSASPCFSWPWQLWGVLIWYFVECPPAWFSRMWFNWVMGFKGGECRGSEVCSGHLILWGPTHAVDVHSLTGHLPHVCLSDFHWKVTSFSFPWFILYEYWGPPALQGGRRGMFHLWVGGGWVSTCII